LPTSKDKNELKIVIDGEEVAPINKHKLPPKVDWQSKALEKRAELAKAAEKQAEENSEEQPE